MKKFVNIRLPVIIALALCAGIACGVLLYFYKLSASWITISVLPATIIIAVWALIRRKIIKPFVFVLLPLILFIGGFLNSYYALARYDFSEIEVGIQHTVHGEVIEKGKTDSGEYIIIDNITVDGNSVDGKAYVYLAPTYGELCDIGYSVDFTGTLENFAPFQYGELNNYAEENIKYRCSVFTGLSSTYGFSLFGSVRSAVRNTLFNNLNEETASISYAMLTGNTQQIDQSSLESFRYGGVAHIFAVSGLHIGIIFGIFSFILNKFKANRYLSAVICLVAIFLYTAVCGFALSALRAAIMCTVATVAKLIGEKYDGLNSLAVAVVIILSITPLSLFSVGFQLSVCAVGGIYCFSKLIEKLLKKIKLPKSASSATGVSFGAQLGTMPVMLSNFGYLSGAGLLLNLIVLPVLSAIYVLIFLSTLLCTAIPAIAPLIMPYAALPLEFMISVFTGARFEKALVSGFGSGAFIIIYFIGILFLSDKINLKAVARIIGLACTVVLLTSYTLLQFYYPFSGYLVLISAYSRGGEVVIKSSQGTVLIVTSDVNTSRLEDALNRNYVNGIDAIIIIGEDDISLYASLDVDCREIYVCDRYPQIQPYGELLIHYESEVDICGVSFTFYNENSIVAEVDGVKFGICAEENTVIRSCDILISDGINEVADCGVEVFFNNRLGTLNVFDCGDIKFKVNKGKFKLINAIPPER